MHSVGDVIAEKYVLAQHLGTGGMGVVYRATQAGLERDVALKLVRPELASSLGVRERFWHEAIAASRAAHRHVIPIIDYDGTHGAQFLVMPYVPGQRLGALVKATGPWSLDRIRRVVKQLLAALVAAHARMIVHGDVKCDNVLVSREDNQEFVTLIDFGLARLPDHPRTEADGAIVSGTPDYLAPEVIEGCAPTAASDLYSVGVILYELLAGCTPFGGADTPTILARHLDQPVPPLAGVCRDRAIPPSLERLVMRALDKDPRTRISRASVFRDELCAIPTHEKLPAEVVDEPTTLEMARDGLADHATEAIRDAVRIGDVDGIIVAYLEHVRVLIDQHRLQSAIDELENAILRLASDANPPNALWRLQLTLAALYDGTGDRGHARELALAGAAGSLRAGSMAGASRARSLLLRLSRRSTRGG